MRNVDCVKAVTAIFMVSLTLTFFVVNVQASSWTKNPTPNDVIVTALDMVNSTDGWAVGSHGRLLHWNGTNWTGVASPTYMSLVSVDMISSNEGYAVAHQMTSPSGKSIIRWDGTSWKTMTTPLGYFNDIDMISSTDGWAVGSDGAIIHWNGNKWSNVESPTGAWLHSVDMISSTEGWILGADGIYHLQLEEETSKFPLEYLLTIGAVITIAVAWLVIRKRTSK